MHASQCGLSPLTIQNNINEKPIFLPNLGQSNSNKKFSKSRPVVERNSIYRLEQIIYS